MIGGWLVIYCTLRSLTIVFSRGFWRRILDMETSAKRESICFLGTDGFAPIKGHCVIQHLGNEITAH